MDKKYIAPLLLCRINTQFAQGARWMEWIIQNKEWLFSGIGLAIVGGIWGFFKKKKGNNTPYQSIKAGDDSNNIQGGKNVNVTIGGKNDKK